MQNNSKKKKPQENEHQSDYAYCKLDAPFFNLQMAFKSDSPIRSLLRIETWDGRSIMSVKPKMRLTPG